MTLTRRRFLFAGASLALSGFGGFLAWPALSGRRWPVANLADATELLESVTLNAWKDAPSGWTPAQTFVHLAQSIEYSMDGYPELKPDWFRASVGPTAHAAFDLRGDMVHDLAAGIPGAPALEADFPVIAARTRLLDAIARFRAHRGGLHPHFAFGVLDHSQFASVHCLHLGDHLPEILQA